MFLPLTVIRALMPALVSLHERRRGSAECTLDIDGFHRLGAAQLDTNITP